MRRVSTYLAVAALTIGLPFAAHVGVRTLDATWGQPDAETSAATTAQVDTAGHLAGFGAATFAWAGAGALAIGAGGTALAIGRRRMVTNDAAGVDLVASHA